MHLTVNQEVGGSSPPWRAKLINTIMKRALLVLMSVWISVAGSMEAKSGYSSSSSSSSSRSSSSGYSSSKSSGSGYSSSKKSTGSGYSSSKSTSKPSSGYSSSKSTTKPSSGYSSSSSTTTKKPSTTTSSSTSSSKPDLFKSLDAKQKIAPPKSRDEYIAEFKKANEQKYKNTFDTQPATRPSHIPAKTTKNGQSYDLNWNPTTRSYGYSLPGSTVFIPYDPLDDLASSSYSTYNSDYNRRASQQTATNGAASVGVGIVIVCLLFAGLVLVVVFFLNPNRNR